MKKPRGTARGYAMPVPGRKVWRLCVLVEIVSTITDPHDADREAERLARAVAAMFGRTPQTPAAGKGET